MQTKKTVGLSTLSKQQRRITLVGVMLAMLLGALDQTIVGTAMPRIIADLGGFAHYTWVTTAYLITSTVAVPITGKLTDMYGRKWFYVSGLIIFVLGSILSGFSSTMSQIIVSRAFQGIGAGVMIANAFTAIGDMFPPAERGKYQGLIAGVFGLSSVIGPFVGGVITDGLSWHWVFFINVPLGVLIILLFLFYFPDFKPNDGKHRVDYLGVLSLMLAVVPAMLVFTWGGIEYPWLSAEIIGMLVFSLAMVLAFVAIERKAKEPIVPLQMFRNRVVAVTMVVIFLTGFVMFGGIVFVPLFFQGVLGLSATSSGSFLTPMMLGTVAGSFVSGQVLSRTGGHYRIQGAFGLIIVTIGMGYLSRLTADTSYGGAMAGIIVMGIGIGMTLPLYTIAVQNAVSYEVLGVATSLTVFFRSIGGSLGLAIFGSVLNNRLASDLMVRLPQSVKSAIPQQQLDSLSHNAQALVSPQAQDQLKASLGTLGPQGTNLLQQLLAALRQALASAIAHVFLIGVFVLLVALAVNFFVKEMPLKKAHASAPSGARQEPPNMPRA